MNALQIVEISKYLVLIDNFCKENGWEWLLRTDAKQGYFVHIHTRERTEVWANHEGVDTYWKGTANGFGEDLPKLLRELYEKACNIAFPNPVLVSAEHMDEYAKTYPIPGSSADVPEAVFPAPKTGNVFTFPVNTHSNSPGEV